MRVNDILSIDNSSLDSVLLCRKQDKISTELDNETIILDIELGVYNGLNSVGTTIWKILEHEVTFDYLCQKLMREYKVDKDTCERDVLLFLQRLSNNELITSK